ncbi:MAG: hypothetical protein ACR2N8_00915 [Parvibaculales bacterium]
MKLSQKPFTPPREYMLFVLRFVPFLIGLSCLIIEKLPFALWFGFPISAFLGFGFLYCWAGFAPRQFGHFQAFLLGLCQDMLMGVHIGVWTCAFLIFYLIIARQAKTLLASEGVIGWMGFAIILLFSVMIIWAIMAIIYGQTSSFLLLIIHYIITLSLYPIFAPLFRKIQRGTLYWEREA